MAELLDLGLELIISEEVDGVSVGVESLVEVGLEGVNDESDLDVAVGGEDLGRVDAAELEAPLVEDNHAVV